jgi:short subunit fatty acids transporter
MIASAGVLYIVRGGEGGEKQTPVKKRILYAAVGLVVAFISWGLAVMIKNIVAGGKL